jgi:hypothetical protein
MNHARLIRNTINKYDAYPTVQQDMRKLLKYSSSWQRMNLEPIINNQPAKTSNPKLDALTAATEEFETTEAFTPAVRVDALEVAKAITAQVILSRDGAYNTLKQELAVKYEDQPAVAEYLKKSALVILAEIEALSPADLLQIRKG